MTRAMATLMLAGAISLFASLEMPGTAQALIQISSPFGANVPVRAQIGRDTQAGIQIIAWQRKSDNACAGTAIGNGSGLVDDFQVSGSSGDDFVWVIFNMSADTIFCNFHMNGLVYGGHYLDVLGLAGNDILSSGDAGDTWLFGMDGNDELIYSGFGNAFGGNGNDTVRTVHLIFTSEGAYGEAGNDCLEDGNGQSFVTDCGSGVDTLAVIAATEPFSTSCELRRFVSCDHPPP